MNMIADKLQGGNPARTERRVSLQHPGVRLAARPGRAQAWRYLPQFGMCTQRVPRVPREQPCTGLSAWP